MAAQLTDIVIVGIYLLILIGIGIIASRKIKNCEDFICAGHSLGFWLFTISRSERSAVDGPARGERIWILSGWPGIWEQFFVPLAISFCVIFFGVKFYSISGVKRDI